MCGIAGILSFEGLPSGQLGQIAEGMSTAIRRRGPDGVGYWSAPGIALGHRRLSIIDVAGGAQPICNETGRVVLVYNGETYNYRDLRKVLQRTHDLRTVSDSEVLVHLYEDKGVECVEAMEGMFAFALWDADRRQLYLAVDPFAIKPLYFYHDRGVFLFCSELRGLLVGLRRLDIEPEADAEALQLYLEAGWFPAPRTPLKSVSKLGPGGRLLVHGDGRLEQLPAVKPRLAQPHLADEREALPLLEICLSRTVEEQLVADVPVGVLLSGGIDSSLVTAMAVKARPGIQTFAVGFTGNGKEVRRADEAAFARAVAEHHGTTHHEIRFDDAALLANLDEVLDAMDEPIADPATAPMLLLSRFAAQHVKVALCGDGGDELFGGYSRYQMLPYKQAIQRLPSWAKSCARAGADALPSRRATGGLDVMRRTRVLAEVLMASSYCAGPFAGQQMRWLNGAASDECCEALRLPATESEVIEREICGQLAGQLLPKSDRISMWASLEVRVPYLSRPMAALASSLHRSLKVRGGVSKYLLRRLAEKYLPPEIAKRRKHGFRVPLSGWFRQELAERVREELGEPGSLPEGIIRSDLRRRMIEQHLSGAFEHSIRIWSLLALKAWFTRHAISMG
jgi:asparagine synthase (glutamine-hydrolysing)